MRKNLLVIVSVLVCGTMLINCGGSGSNSGAKKNQYLGSVPTLYINYEAERDAYEKKADEEGMKLMAGGEKNKDKFEKLTKEVNERLQAMKDKFEADVKTEVQKLASKDIPVSYSENLKNSNMLFYDISSAKLVDDNGKLKISFDAIAKNDFTVPYLKGPDHRAYCRLVTSQGDMIMKTAFPQMVKSETKALDVKAGEKLLEGYKIDPLSNLKKNPDGCADFAGIEFITSEEYLAKE